VKILYVETKPNAPNVTWQHIWSFDETKDALFESNFFRIPNEIMLRIFKLLSVPELCKVSLVCRRFKMIADQDEIWKLKCNSKYCIFLLLFVNIYIKQHQQNYIQYHSNICIWTGFIWNVYAIYNYAENVIGTQLHVLGVHHPHIPLDQLANITSKLLVVFINIQTHHHLCMYYSCILLLLKSRFDESLMFHW
jgi:hypothetical protein